MKFNLFQPHQIFIPRLPQKDDWTKVIHQRDRLKKRDENSYNTMQTEEYGTYYARRMFLK